MSKEKKCDLICSGKSSENIKINSNIIIVANNSILNKKLKDNCYIIWFLGSNYRYIDMKRPYEHHIFRDTIPNIEITPNELHIKYVGHPIEFRFFECLIKKHYPNIKIFKMNNRYNKKASTGINSLQYAVDNYNKIYVSGLELGEESFYDYNKDFKYLYCSKQYHTGLKYKNNLSQPDHINLDKQIINNIIRNKKVKRIIANQNSGLYKFLQKNN